MIKWGKSKKVKNQILFFSKPSDLALPYLVEFAHIDMALKKDEDGKIKVFPLVEEGKIIHYILVRYKNTKVLKQQLDTFFLPQIKKTLEDLNQDFVLDLDRYDFSFELKRSIEDLLVYSLYKFSRYKDASKGFNLWINDSSRPKTDWEAIKESIFFTRDLVNEPPAEVNPQSMEELIKDRFNTKENVKIEVIKWNKLAKLWLNGIWNVWRGSEYEPRLIIIKYLPQSKKGFKYALVGKGVTFDSGGYNLKPTGYMEDMKSDMAWAAAVLGALDYLIKVKHSNNLIVAVPLVENLVSGKAYKPWDIIKMYNWKTVEVGNTDAEGRLILADALAFIEDKYSPQTIIDVATLTWAQIIALGNKIAALMWSNSKLNNKLKELSWELYERVWELPLFKPYFDSMKSYIADFANVSNQKWWPWTITAGLFLSQFVKTSNRVHLDIAGPAGVFSWVDPLYGPWATGFGARLLAYFIVNN